MKRIKKLTAVFFLFIMIVSLIPFTVHATDFQDDLNNMPVVPGSPADSRPSVPEPTPSPEPTPEPTPSPEPAPQPSSSKAPSSSNRPAPSRPSSRPASSAVQSRSEESSNTSQNLPKAPSSLPSFADFNGGVSSENSSQDLSLPSVGEVSAVGELTESGTEITTDNKFNIIGIISWVCIGLGVLVVIIVLLSTARRPPRGGGGYGRKRYHRKPNKPRKKKLLNDKYYRNLKY